MAKEQTSNMWLPSVVLASLAAISYLVHETVYQSSRPVDSQSWSRKLEDPTDVEARLWQDPFFAVDQHIKAEDGTKPPQVPAAHHTLAAMGKRISAGDTSDASTLTFLAVMVPNAPYAEQAERRRRIRYAVLSGLSRSAMVPENQEHIAYFEPDSPLLPKVVPYEILRHDGTSKRGGPGRVVVLWLATEASEPCPLRRVATLFDGVAGAARGKKQGWDYAVLGPPESGTLAEMFVESLSGCNDKPALDSMIKQIKVYSPFASAAGRELAYTVGSRLDQAKVRKAHPNDPAWPKLIEPCLQDGRTALQEPLQAADCDMDAVIQKAGVNFVRLIADDVLLANALFDELKLRGVDPGCEALERQLGRGQGRPDCFDGPLDRHRIAVVSEWDTPYQRSLRKTLKRVLSERCAAQYPVQPCQAALDAQWILPFSYMRGVDGQVAGEAPPPKEQKHESGNSAPQESLERADGNRQFDYLRRLAERIARRDAELEASGQSGIGAIAVLGSDPYDKLTILQALHEQLPDKVFVTTNLDARLLHPNESKWARNLVVVSGFGLELQNELQGYVPPLRDGYQTAAFFATQIAVMDRPFKETVSNFRDQRSRAMKFAGRPCADHGSADAAASWLAPQVFEIGRTGAVKLERCPQLQQTSTLVSCPNRDYACLQVHPPSRAVFDEAPERARMPMSIGAGLVMAALVLLAWPTRKAQSETQSAGPTLAPYRPTRLKVAMAGAAFLLVAWIAYCWNDIWLFLTDAGAGEPGFLFEGISLWPAQIIRGTAFVLALVFLRRAHVTLQTNAHEIAAAFPVPKRPASGAQPAHKAESCLRKLCDSSGAWLSQAWNWLTGAMHSREAPVGADSHSTDPQQADQHLDAWTRYCHEADTCPRFVRVLAWAAAYTVISFCLIRIWPVTASFRGSFSYTVNAWLVTLCVAAFNLLLFYVFDALYICNRCIKRFSSSKLQWSDETYDKFRTGADLKNEHLDHWIAVHMIGRRTEAVGPLIYWPFVLLFLIILARNSVFEHWELVPSVIGYWLMSAALLVYAALNLRMTTEAERNKAIDTLTAQLLVAKGSNNAVLAGQLQMMLDQLNGYREGAFASYADQHFVRALLLPLAGVAGSLLINYLSIVKP